MRKCLISGSMLIFILLFLTLIDFNYIPSLISQYEAEEVSEEDSNSPSEISQDITIGDETKAQVNPQPMKDGESSSKSPSDNNQKEMIRSHVGLVNYAEMETDSYDQITRGRALALVGVAQDFYDRSLFKEGLPWANDALRLDPSLPEANLISGILYFKLCNYENAIAAFEKTIELESTNFEAHLHLGIIYNGKDNPDLAIEYLDQAIRLARSFEDISMAYTHRSLSYALMERYENSLADLNDALYLNPDNGWAILALGVITKEMEAREKFTSECEGIPGLSTGVIQ